MQRTRNRLTAEQYARAKLAEGADPQTVIDYTMALYPISRIHATELVNGLAIQAPHPKDRKHQ